MSKVVVRSFAVSMDGFGAGPDQSLEHPLGVNGPDLMEWFFPTVVFRQMHGEPGNQAGGVATVRQYLEAGLIDDLHLAVRSILMGAGERLFEGLDLRALGYEVTESVPGERATHVFIRRRP